MAQKMLEDEAMLEDILRGCHDSDLDFSDSDEEEESGSESSSSESDMEVEEEPPCEQGEGSAEQQQPQQPPQPQPSQPQQQQSQPQQYQQQQQRQQQPPQPQPQAAKINERRAAVWGDSRPSPDDARPGPSGQGCGGGGGRQPQQPQQLLRPRMKSQVTIQGPTDRQAAPQQPQQAPQPIPVIGGGCAAFQVQAPPAAAVPGWRHEQAGPSCSLAYQHASPLNRDGRDDERRGRDKKRRDDRDRDTKPKGRNWYRPYSKSASRQGGNCGGGGGRNSGPGQQQQGRRGNRRQQPQPHPYPQAPQPLLQPQPVPPQPQQQGMLRPDFMPHPSQCPPFPREPMHTLRAKPEPGNAVALSNLVKSLQKISVPQHMLRRRDCSPPCIFTNIPQATPGLVVPATPKTEEMKPEKFTDSMVQKMVDRGMSPQDCLNKLISYRKLDQKFEAIKTFTSRTVNFVQWLDQRKETITNSGLMTLVMFLEELCAWAKLNLQHGCNLEERDLILHTSETVCSQLMFKLKPIISCVEPNKAYASMAKQMSYLLSASGRIQDAGMLLREIKVGTPLTTLMGFATCIPVMVTCKTRNPPLYEYCKSFLEMYQPGILCALCNIMTAKLNTTCTEDECYGNVRATIGFTVNTKGLLFAPGV
ncbi:multifunctional expression regulator [Equid gammaherpesvirus 5]|uniref:Multifunctional expression regulator n=1 Tax=Equid gammaherpesvirus 5 TaxID=10371 RepID=A0A0B4Q5K5_9GAMA|nr:multifunctional expression regulator [Equid gammaherpesvirus 5]AIU39582.1 multifunctional expression regulator [Equid gammaherpesvirus 5]APT43377.1 multifunctional expression regulator [Equid gammaherpesvirus 5]